MTAFVIVLTLVVAVSIDLLTPGRPVPLVYPIAVLIAATRCSTRTTIAVAAVSISLDLVVNLFEGLSSDLMFLYDGSFLCVSATMVYVSAVSSKQRKEIDSKTHEAELHYANLTAIAENSSSAVFLKDRESRFLLINQQAAETLGTTSEAVIGKTDREVYADSAVAERMIANDQLVLATETAQVLEEMIPLADGVHTFLTTKFPIRNQAGQITGVGGIATDITERKLAEAALRRSENMYRTLSETSQDMVFMLGHDGRFEYGNSFTAKLFGLTPQELIGKPLTDIFGAVEGAPRKGILGRVFSTGETVHLESDLLLGDRTVLLDTLLVPVRNEANEIVSVMGVSRDMTEQRSLSARLEGVLRTMNEGLWILDKDLRFQYVNEAYCRMTGYSMTEILSMKIPDLDVNESLEEAERHIKKIIDGGKDLFETRHRHKDGQLVDFEISVHYDPEMRLLYCILRDITARRQAEERLRRSEADLRMAQELSHVGSWRWDVVHKALEWSDEMYRIFGLEKDANEGYITEARDRFVHPDDRDLVTEFNNKAWQDGKPEPVEYRIVRPDGEVRVVRTEAGELIYDNAGRTAFLMGVVQDITERKRVEELITQNEARLRDAQRIGHVGNWDWNILTNELYWSEEMYRIYGWPPDGSPPVGGFLNAVDPTDLEMVQQAIEDALNGRKPYDIDVPVTRSDGSKAILHAQAEVTFDGSNKPIRMLGTIQDITERKRAEELITQNEMRLREAQRVGHVGNWEWNPQTNELYWSEENYRIYGLALDVTPSVESFLATVDPLDLEMVKQAIEDAVTGKKPYDLDMRIIKGDGSKAVAHAQAEVTFDESGRPLRMFGTVQDITERKQMEEQLLRAQKMELAGQIAGQVAHDFNNLLSPITAYPELIRMRLPEDHPAMEYLGLIEDSAHQMAYINEDLLTLARRGHANQEPLILNGLINQTLRELTTPSTLEIEVDLASNLLPVRGSAAQLVRVISNLIANARDAMLEVGTLRIKTDNVLVGREQAGIHRVKGGEYLRLQVKDTGSGMSAETQQRIFEPFFSTKIADRRRGTGLGLSIVQSIVADHDGFVEVESQLGIGTTFSLYFPVSKDLVQVGKRSEVQSGTEYVLIVDDDAIQRQVTGKLLTELGYDVLAAESGEAAVACINEKQFDLVLLDMIMPGGMDGLETYEKIQAIRPEQKVLMVSGYAETERVKKAQALGAGGFLAKPIALHKLAEAVRRELDRK